MKTRVVAIYWLGENIDRDYIMGKLSGIITALTRKDRRLSMWGNNKYPNSNLLIFEADNEAMKKIKKRLLKEFGYMTDVCIVVYEQKYAES